MRKTLVIRVRVMAALFVLAAVLLLVRLYFIQIVHGDEYRRQAIGQYLESGESDERGDIFFTTKDKSNVAAAIMQNGWRVAITPKDIEDADKALQELARRITLDEKRFQTSVAKKDDPYEEVAFRLSDSEAAAVRSAKIPGVITVRDKWRLYPGESLAAHAIGFVGFAGDERRGVYGLERYWDDTLSMNSDGLNVNPFAEIFSNISALTTRDPHSHKGSLVTSIEPVVERELEAALEKVRDAYSPKVAGGIVMDPKTGEILAIGVTPAFDPNKYNLVEDPARFANPLIESRYELGSIMKPLTIAAAIDAGAISPRTTYNDAGCIVKTGARLCNFDRKGRGVVDMQEVLSQSLNTGVSYAADAMGHSRFAEYVKKFELGEETGIDLPGEIAGNIDAIFVDGAADVDFASASFGQSIAVTPIAMIRALSALANDGKLPEPHVVRAVRNQTGFENKVDAGKGTQVIKPETAHAVTEMLIKVFDDALLEGQLKQEHHTIAAKTGTAQIAIPGGGGYYTDRWLHSFFGYFPAHDPKFIILLFAIEPRGEAYASRTLARPFLDVAKFLINYYELPPDR